MLHHTGERRGAVGKAEEFAYFLLHSELAEEREVVGRSVSAAAAWGNKTGS